MDVSSFEASWKLMKILNSFWHASFQLQRLQQETEPQQLQ